MWFGDWASLTEIWSNSFEKFRAQRSQITPRYLITLTVLRGVPSQVPALISGPHSFKNKGGVQGGTRSFTPTCGAYTSDASVRARGPAMWSQPVQRYETIIDNFEMNMINCNSQSDQRLINLINLGSVAYFRKFHPLNILGSTLLLRDFWRILEIQNTSFLK